MIRPRTIGLPSQDMLVEAVNIPPHGLSRVYPHNLPFEDASSMDEPQYDQSSKSTFHWLIAITALTGFGSRLFLLFTTHRTAEDFYITLRYAENIAHGNGFVYNAGQHVMGTTTPLYTLFLALLDKLSLNATLGGQLLNVAADAASCYFLYRLTKAAVPDGGEAFGIIAAAVYAIWPPSLYWSISGMETSIVTLCGLAAFTAVAEKKPYLVAVWCAALVLLRIDGLLLAGVAFAGLTYQNRLQTYEENKQPLTKPVLLFLVLLTPWMLFAFIYFGSPVPTSLIAKLHVYAWQNPGVLPNLKPFANDMTRNGLYYVLLIGVIAGIPAIWRHKDIRPAIIWMLVYYAGMAFSKSFLFGWYYVPPAPFYILTSIVGWSWIVGSLGRRVDGSVVGTVGVGRFAIAVGVILLAGIVLAPKQKALIQADQNQDEALLKSTGVMLRNIIKPGETLMLEPIGWIGYYSRAEILDAVGLVSPEIIPYFHAGAVSPYLDIMAEIKPTYALLRTGEYTDAIKANVPPERGLQANYELVREIPNPTAPFSAPAFYLLKRKQ